MNWIIRTRVTWLHAMRYRRELSITSGILAVLCLLFIAFTPWPSLNSILIFLVIGLLVAALTLAPPKEVKHD